MKGRKIRILTVTVLALCLVFTMSGLAFAGSSVTLSGAYQTALKDAGLTKQQVKNVEKEYDDGRYEIGFTKKGTRIEYEYEISKSGKIIEKTVDYNRKRVKGAKKLTENQAISKVSKFSGIKSSFINNGRVRLERDDGQWIYEIKFSKGNIRYDYEVHARTGKILEYSRKAI